MNNYLRYVMLSGMTVFMLNAIVPPSWAQDYPSRPIRLILPYPPGGAADNTARILAPRMGEALGQQFVIDNRSGATGVIGAESPFNLMNPLELLCPPQP